MEKKDYNTQIKKNTINLAIYTALWVVSLAIATFGRGFYIMDDYSPLRAVSAELEEKEAAIFPIKDALMFVQTSGKSNQGNTYFTSPNPEFGATLTFFFFSIKAFWGASGLYSGIRPILFM